MSAKGKNTLTIPIEPHFAGDYRLEYDGKYVTLFGKDNRYEVNAYFTPDPPEYEEMVLVPCVVEVRRASPCIQEVTEGSIVISLNLDGQKP